MNLEILSYAERYYQQLGFSKVCVPWLVEEAVSNLTKPDERRNFLVNELALVGSAEQGYLQMMLQGELAPGRYVATTPCFRDEESLDFWHQQYFIKTELIDTAEVSPQGLERMIANAESFFSRFLRVKRVKIGVDMVDLVEVDSNTELGSYGLRSGALGGKDLSWVYGTGCAEPRLSKVLGLQGKYLPSFEELSRCS